MSDEQAIAVPESAPDPAAAAATPAEPATRREAIEAAVNERQPDTRPRDEAGKFTAAPKADPAPAPAEPAVERKAREYPKSWRAEYKPAWQRLESDPELSKVLEEVERREADFHKGIEQYKADAQLAQTFREAIRPFEATWQARGIEAPKAVQMMLAADHVLRYGTAQEKARAVQTLASDYGIDLAAVAAPAQQQEQPPPFVQDLIREVNILRQQVYGVQQYTAQAHDATLNSEIDAFKRDHEHFDALAADMGRLIQAGLADSLPDAYEKALWSRPDMRETLLAKQREADAKRAHEAAQKAKAAAVQVRGGPVAGVSANPTPTDRRAAIAAAFDARV